MNTRFGAREAYQWGHSVGRRVRAGTLEPLAWLDGSGRPIEWRTSDKAFPRGYRAGLEATP